MKSYTKYVWIIAVALCLTGLANLSVKSQEKSLYQRLGGKKAITAVVDDFTTRVLGDTRINMFFAHTDIPHFKQCIVNQLCKATGGPCKYTCRSMKDTHAGMGVTTADFNATVEDLVATLNKFKVGKTEQDELLAILGPMKKDIVEKP